MSLASAPAAVSPGTAEAPLRPEALAARCAFTTLPWDGGRGFATPGPYFGRLRADAARLGIAWPAEGLAARLRPALLDALDAAGRPDCAEAPAAEPPSLQPPGLLRVELGADGAVRCTLRALPPSAGGDAWQVVSRAAPRFGASATGTKHGDWDAYRDATSGARSVGAGVSLLVHRGDVVDCDRCTPLVLCADGRTVLHPARGAGAVHSVTAELVRPALAAAGLDLREGRVPLASLRDAEEVVVVGSGVGVRQISCVDGASLAGRGARLLQLAAAALRAAREGAWLGPGAVAEAADAAAASGPPGRGRWPAPAGDWFMPAVAEVLARGRLWGAGAEECGWPPDQLLLHSGGPAGDVARFSLLAGPPTLRFRAHQPRSGRAGPLGAGAEDDAKAAADAVGEACGAKRRRLAVGGALRGRVRLLAGGGGASDCADRPDLEWTVEAWAGDRWEPAAAAAASGGSLAAALRAVGRVAADVEPVGRWPRDGDVENAGALKEEDELPIGASAVSGLLGYHLTQWTEPLALAQAPEPGGLLGVLYRVDRWVIHDRHLGVLWLRAPPGDVWAASAQAQLREALPTLRPAALPEPPEPARGPGPRSSISDEEHANVVRLVQDAIEGGFLYQLNFARQWTGQLREAPWELMRRLFADNPAPFSAFLHAPDERLALCSSSPESLLSVRGGVATTSPIKGTCPRGGDAAEDAALRAEMAASRKEVAEHLMLVDLMRHDLGQVCDPGSVLWERWRVETFPAVQHMVSLVRGRLRDDADSWEALGVLFPGGSVTGCPKTVTIAAIEELESCSRGFWTGSMGYVDLDRGDSQWSILIRTLEARRCGENGSTTWTAEVKAGGGLTIASDPAAEVEEAKLKAARLLRAAFGGGAPAGAGAGAPPPAGDGAAAAVQASGLHDIAPGTAPRVAGLLRALRGGVAAAEGPRDGVGTWQRWAARDDAGRPLQARAPVRPRVLLVDNLDSFTINIADALAALGAEVVMVDGRGPSSPRAEEALAAVRPTHVVLGPGPGRPDASALTAELASEALSGRLTAPLLGVCLGHQALGLARGWELAPSPLGAVHGVPEEIFHDGLQLFAGLPSPATMVRYNSLVLRPAPNAGAPATGDRWEGDSVLQVTAWDSTRTLPMGVRHSSLPVCGVQFHPESAGSHGGSEIFRAFLRM